MKNYIIALLLVTLTAAMVSCEVEETLPIYGPDGAILQHPGRVKVEQPTGEPAQGEIFTIVDSNSHTVTTIKDREWVDLEAGQYALVGYTNGELFNLAGTVITLKSMSGVILTDGIRGGADAFAVVEDDWSVASVAFKRLTRTLRIVGELEGITTAEIESGVASLAGLAGGIDLTNGFGAVTISSGGYTVPITVSIVDGKLVMEINLLGIVVNEDQLLTIELTLANGKKQTVTMSLKEILKSFNTGNADQTVNITIKLSTDTEAKEPTLSGTIIDWEEGGQVEIPGI